MKFYKVTNKSADPRVNKNYVTREEVREILSKKLNKNLNNKFDIPLTTIRRKTIPFVKHIVGYHKPMKKKHILVRYINGNNRTNLE